MVDCSWKVWLLAADGRVDATPRACHYVPTPAARLLLRITSLSTATHAMAARGRDMKRLGVPLIPGHVCFNGLPPAAQGPHFWDEAAYPVRNKKFPTRYDGSFPAYVSIFDKAAARIHANKNAITGEASSNTFTAVFSHLRCAPSWRLACLA